MTPSVKEKTVLIKRYHAAIFCTCHDKNIAAPYTPSSTFENDECDISSIQYMSLFYIGMLFRWVFFSAQPYGDYWVLDTDYETYTLVYSCSDILVSNVQFLWILAREKTLDDATVARLTALAAGYGIRADKLNVTSQKDCWVGWANNWSYGSTIKNL